MNEFVWTSYERESEFVRVLIYYKKISNIQNTQNASDDNEDLAKNNF